ncbi:MAG: sigma-54-dependent Fis family transcriptional regulator [Ignavibacteriae bacterium]|nr:sigma-54-dependent Fis family transcriptional regulator [Ignavibacteriota bacterium]
MSGKKEHFRILLCGKKEMMADVRRLITPAEDVHLQFASSPSFLVGRALFHAPRLVLIDVTRDNQTLRSSLKEFCSEMPEVPIVALAHEPDHGFAVELVKMGVSAYFIFPDEHRKIREHVSLLYYDWQAKKQKERYVEIQQEVYDFRSIVGESPLLKIVVERAQRVIRNNTLTVLITGETGTGKELFARAIHYNSKNRNSPFVDIACTALPESLLEAELFGYERGAFTDAKERKVGLFELAGDGSIFLDEIGDISMSTQSKLLRVIEDRTLRRVGGIRNVPVRARIIAATSADLDAKMRAGEFRRDLYHRLKILPLELPSLADRMEDIPQLIDFFLKRFNQSYNKKIKGVTPQAMQLLLDHQWEGNVRELKHAIERAVLLEDGDWLSDEVFELDAKRARQAKKRPAPSVQETTNLKLNESIMLVVPFEHASANEVQHMLAHKVLAHVNNNKVRAARILKISRPRLDRILRGKNNS